MNPIVTPLLLLLLTLLATAFVARTSWQSSRELPQRIRLLSTGLRMLLVLLLALIAANPGRWVNENDLIKQEWAVLTDQSNSMLTIDDAASGETRFARATAIATQLKNLPESEVTQIDFAQNQPTDLIAAGMQTLDKYRGANKRLRGLIYLSDGIQVAPTDSQRLIQLAQAQGTPVYGHLIGGPIEQADIDLHAHRRLYTSFAGQKQKLTAVLRNHGLGDIKTSVRLTDEHGKEFSKTEVELTDGAQASVELYTNELTPGYHHLYLETDVLAGEQLSENNRVLVGINTLDSRINVLLMEGIPHWDNKFLVQLLRQQNYINLTTVHRLTNERYFRVDTGDGAPVEVEEAAFPEDAAAIARFDVIILGKGAEYYLTAARIQRLKAFVRDHGGTLLLARGRPYATSMPEFESLEPVEWGQRIQADMQWKPTPTGEAVGLFGPILPGIDDDVWSHLAPIIAAYRAPLIKPFSQVLVEGRYAAAADARIPMVISRRYGQGMILAVNSEGLWRWDFFPTFHASGELYRDFWTQMVQWSTTHADFLPGQKYAIELNRSVATPGESILAKIRTRNVEAPEDTLSFTLEKMGGEAVERSAQRGAQQTWNAVLTLNDPGSYTLRVGEHILQALTIEALPDERARLSTSDELLAPLSQQTGGQLLDVAGLLELVKPLPPAATTAPTGQATWKPGWAGTPTFLFIAFIAALEWIIRRRHGKL